MKHPKRIAAIPNVIRLGQWVNMVSNFYSWGMVTHSMVVIFVSFLAGLINFDNKTGGFFTKLKNGLKKEEGQ